MRWDGYALAAAGFLTVGRFLATVRPSSGATPTGVPSVHLVAPNVQPISLFGRWPLKAGADPTCADRAELSMRAVARFGRCGLGNTDLPSRGSQS